MVEIAGNIFLQILVEKMEAKFLVQFAGQSKLTRVVKISFKDCA